MLYRDKMTGLGIELNDSVTAELVMEGIDAFSRNKKYIDYTSDWYVQTMPDQIIIAMSATDGFLSGCAHNDYSENKLRIFGWLECYFAMKGVRPKDAKFNHYCGFSPFNRDKEYKHLGSGKIGQFFQTVIRFGNWSTEQSKNIKPYIEIQNWHGDTKLNSFISLAEKYNNLIDPNEYIRYINENKNRHLYTGEINNVFCYLPQEQKEELEFMAVLKYGPLNTKHWYQAVKEAEKED